MLLRETTHQHKRKKNMTLKITSEVNLAPPVRAITSSDFIVLPSAPLAPAHVIVALAKET